MEANISCCLMCKSTDDEMDLQQELNLTLNYDLKNKEYEIFKVELKSWELEDVLSALFKKIAPLIPKLKLLVLRDKIKLYIDICIVHYDKYPALIIEGNNMDIIRELKADIAIDIY